MEESVQNEITSNPNIEDEREIKQLRIFYTLLCSCLAFTIGLALPFIVFTTINGFWNNAAEEKSFTDNKISTDMSNETSSTSNYVSATITSSPLNCQFDDTKQCAAPYINDIPCLPNPNAIYFDSANDYFNCKTLLIDCRSFIDYLCICQNEGNFFKSKVVEGVIKKGCGTSWSPWGNWIVKRGAACSSDPDAPAFAVRYRICNNPPPFKPEYECVGPNKEIKKLQTCNLPNNGVLKSNPWERASSN